MPKYERLLVKMLPGARRFLLQDAGGGIRWDSARDPDASTVVDTSAADWVDVGAAVQRYQKGKLVTLRVRLTSATAGNFGYLAVQYDTGKAVPLEASPEKLAGTLGDIAGILQDEVELQSECDQLAIELAERYEELNLVYSTKDQVDYFEEGHEALVALVANCADYLDVDLSALICRDRGLELHHCNLVRKPSDTDRILGLLATTVYDRVESQVKGIVLNETDVNDRNRIFGGRTENLIAYPVIDDHGVAIGILAVVVAGDSYTFSNGDRNLLEVMAKKASRIIHTHHDSLTGLMNRSGFESSLVATLSNARSTNSQHCLLHVDIDQLHVINDLMGYQEGDNLIRRVAKTLRSLLRDSDSVARLGGDEFGILLPNCAIEQGQKVAEKIRDAVGQISVITTSRQIDITTSVGVAALTRSTAGIVAIMASAEIACKAAKEEGRNLVKLFEEDNTVLVRRTEEIEWIGRIQEALRDDKFTLFCQPVTPIDAANNAMHYEILVRLVGAKGEILSPGEFMPAAERYQLMPMIDRWVLHRTLSELKANWHDIRNTSAVFCINLSGQSLTNPGFLAFVTDELDQSGIPAPNICFEITETAAISNIDEATSFMSAVRDLGCAFSLDDFGAGLSSFGYLKQLPVDYLKIDGSFVREMATDTVSYSMVTAIYQIARSMKLKTVAEFVENDVLKNLLAEIGIDYVQGYGIGKPVPLDQSIDELRSRQVGALA